MRRRIKKNLPNGTIVGLDLSLRAAAACAIPFNWDHDLDNVQMEIFGEKLGTDATPLDYIQRIVTIADGVLAFCQRVQARKVYVEAYAFSQGGRNATQLAELGGAVKSRLYDEWGIAACPIVASSARKILLQKLPRSDIKKFVTNNVKRLGGRALGWTHDEIDALVIANAGLMREGGLAMTFEGVQ